jgi:hypothetical protein
MITKGLIIWNGAQILFDVADGSEQCTITMDPFHSAFGGFAILPEDPRKPPKMYVPPQRETPGFFLQAMG